MFCLECLRLDQEECFFFFSYMPRQCCSVRKVCSSYEGAAPFFAGSIPVDLLKCAVQPSRYLRRHTASGGGVVRAAALSFLPFLRQKGADREKLKFELLTEISPLSRSVNATEEDFERIDEICQQLEKLNPTKDLLKSPLLSGKWKLLYTTSDLVLLKSRPAIVRPNGPIYQAINTDTLRAQNLETWPFLSLKQEPRFSLVFFATPY